MVKQIRHIALVLLMLLIGGMTNEICAQQVTYHILTIPFNVKMSPLNSNYHSEYVEGDTRNNIWNGIRVEAIRCTSSASFVALPPQFISPLATNFRFYKTATYSQAKLYDNEHDNRIIKTEYDIYTDVGDEVHEGDLLESIDNPTDIYVTYDFNNATSPIKLDGSQAYNVTLENRYLCYNKTRANRPGAALASTVSSEDLATNDFVKNVKGIGNSTLYLNFMFKYEGNDPYNVTIKTAYDKDDTYDEHNRPDSETNKVKKEYRDASLFVKLENNKDNNGSNKMWLASDAHKRWETPATSPDPASFTSLEGFFRGNNSEMNPIVNAFAILPRVGGTGYIYVVSKLNQNGIVYQPNNSGYYAVLVHDGGNDPKIRFKAVSNVQPSLYYEVKTYTYKVTTPSGQVLSATVQWSAENNTETLLSHVPDALKRKFVTFTGAYKDADLDGKDNNELTSFADADSDADGHTPGEVWLKYTCSMPFDALPWGGDYTDARWYTMRMNGASESKFIAYHDNNNFITTDGSGNAKGSNVASNLHTGENSAEAMVAFIGDPFELKILSRAACEADGENRYIGCATDATDNTTLNTNKTGSSDISTWELVYETENMGNIILRAFNSYANPKYIGWNSDAGNKPVVFSTSSYTNNNRIKVVELAKVNYTYRIMRSDGSIAIKATVTQDVGKALRTYLDIPEIIRSPFLVTATVNYYSSSGDATNNNPGNAIKNAPYASTTDVYVRYSFDSPPIAGSYNVRLNNEYIYTTTNAEERLTDNTIYSKESITTGEGNEAQSPPFIWELDYSDPYAMTVKSSDKAHYVKVASWENEAVIAWDPDVNNASRFIVKKAGEQNHIYEVMAATGESYDAGDGDGVTTTYFNIGRNTANTVRLYANNPYAHGYAQLRFHLTSTSASEITYHLIDTAGKDLLQAKTGQVSTDTPEFPPEFRSPLVEAYHYYPSSAFDFDGGTNTYTFNGSAVELQEIGSNAHVYVTYNVNNLVNLRRGQMYLLKYKAGQNFCQEDGSDGLLAPMKTDEQIAALSEEERKAYYSRYQAVYPYCNGDCNFFVYGQEQYEIQQQGAASTRTRWAWYLESSYGEKGDPYHVKIMSRQSETYNEIERNAYFSTYQPEDYDQMVTGLVWPSISGIQATEYMILGDVGQYQLMTTHAIPLDANHDGTPESTKRYVVKSFEQYWKTYDTIRRKVLKQPKNETYPDDKNGDETVPDTPYAVGDANYTSNRTYLTNEMGWHHYTKWAYAKRWNGYNAKGETKKGWENKEHWFQTVDMGEGYFDFEKAIIDPALILLDQHGWEIMRKPLPSSPDDPDKAAKYDAIRPYNSPMVKEYAFWATAKKRTGFHQYYLLSDRIGGDDFTSNSLTSLPPYGSKNVLDKKGNLNDQYVTYIVKDEYAQSYNPSDKTGAEFLIEQGTKYASTSDGETITKNNVSGVVSMTSHITEGSIPESEMWYVKPNSQIDFEMGYGDASYNWGDKTPNAYSDDRYKTQKSAVYIEKTEEYLAADENGKKALTDKFGKFSFSNGFDPYNIQITPKNYATKFLKTNATAAKLDDGDFEGTYPGTPPSPEISLDVTTSKAFDAIWYDTRKLPVTNATFMAVQDEDGHMQLMPRFDNDVRMSEFSTLIAPSDANVASTYTNLYRPVVYDYRIIDNEGHESLRYKSGGDLVPQTPDHFKSPLATNFRYYKSTTFSEENQINESLGGVDLTDNIVYVRYEYNPEADDNKILKGNWLTMQINGKDAQYASGIKEGTKDATHVFQWKFLQTPQTDPDPYAVRLFNRDYNKTRINEPLLNKRFALLSHGSDYALAEAGLGTADSYKFLNGDGNMSTEVAAATAIENGFTSSAGAFAGTNSQVKLYDDITHTFTYKVYTNGLVHAIDAVQSNFEVLGNEWKPELPYEARNKLLELEDYLYYEKNSSESVEDAVSRTALTYLYGLYDDEVYVRYRPYNELVSNYKVPNVKGTSGGHVVRGSGSNDTALELNNSLLYNIIWYDDEMMRSYKADLDGGSPDNVIRSTTGQGLQSDGAYEWSLVGNDPYAIQIKSVGASSEETSKYIHEATTTTCDLNASATTFMLLNREGYEYGVLTKTGSAVTGETPVMLSGYGHELSTNDPTHFIIFALATYKVIYHLMIKNTGESITIPYRASQNESVTEDYEITKGTTQRDLTSKVSLNTSIEGDLYQLGKNLWTLSGEMFKNSPVIADRLYCVDAGCVSLGDVLEVPEEFSRPNVVYRYFIEGVYNSTGTEVASDMNTKYRGLERETMGDDPGLLGKTVIINIVYSFNGSLDTNAGNGFVVNVGDNQWYTFETNDATPWLAQFTNAWGLKVLKGRESHYTNDYLWTPLGDPYGFRMYNRYIYKTDGVTNKVLTTANIAENEVFKMDSPDANSIYELLSSTTPGSFKVHPMVNKSGTQYYLYNNNGTVILSTNSTEWTFGLSKDLMKPYYDRAGYVGGLTQEGKEKYIEAGDNLTEIQQIVYNDNYIVPFASGYYRLHSPVSATSIQEERYASGYTHEIEKTHVSGGLPIHFYEKNETALRQFTDLGSGFTVSPATRGELPVAPVANDPASIFYISSTENNATGHPLATLSTQGMNVLQNKMTTGDGTTYCIMDIGGAVFLIHDNAVPASRMYFNYDQTNASDIYDLKFSHDIPTDDARWCLKPVQKGTTAGPGELGLKVTTNNGNDGYYYATFCAPFDVLMTDVKDFAYIIPSSGWNPTIVHPTKVPASAPYDEGKFVPAGTPVIIRTSNTSGSVTLALPSTSSASSLNTDLTGKYLEQLLDEGAGNEVYVFGLPYDGTFTKDEDYNNNGIINASVPSPGKGVGFYINANPNRESSEYMASWTRNNRYVYANKAYYRSGSSGASAPAMSGDVQFVPVIFGDEEPGEEELQPDGSVQVVGDGCIYDLQGRKVATQQQVEDGTWRERLAPGIYILNGKKFKK